MLRIAPAAVLAVVLTIPLTAQKAAFIGIVADSASGSTLSGISVTAVEAQRQTTTDNQGRFRLEGIETGLHTVLVRGMGYEPWALRFNLTVVPGMEVDLGRVVLTGQPALELDPIAVEGEEYLNNPSFQAFQRRMRTEKGTFFTASDIAAEAPARTSDLLRKVQGFRTLGNGDIASTRGIPSIMDGFSQCTVAYYVDGVHASLTTLDNVNPNALAGVEIYRGAASTPHIYQGVGNSKCGVVAVWTKGGRPGERR